MRILNLHHELWREHAPKIDQTLSQPDVVILAGDINTGAKAVEWAATTFKGRPVLYVHGNHEGYGQNLDDTEDAIQAACAASDEVHALNCGEKVIDGVRFLGATLWTDFKLFGDDERQASMREAEAVMTDYKRIRLARKGYRKLRAADTAHFHSIQRSWLKNRLEEPFLGKTVVVTHMAPSLLSILDQYREAPESAAYASRLEELAGYADLWVHGHIHESLDYNIGKCRVVCNPCGYRTRTGGIENAQFDSNFIVEI